MKPSEYLDAAKARLNITSDYALALLLSATFGSVPATTGGAGRRRVHCA